MPELRVGVVVRDDTLYVDVRDVVGMLRHRADQYDARADRLAELAANPNELVEALDRDLVTSIDEALACRMVAEELRQRADVLDGIG